MALTWKEHMKQRRGCHAKMDVYTVSFFGHRRISNLGALEKHLEEFIRKLLLEKEYLEFLVGRNGDFDLLVASTIKRTRRIVRDDNSALIWVLPYPTAELRDNLEDYRSYYDEIEVCSDRKSTHPKGAYQLRNRQMIDRSDLVVVYVDHSSGGAYQTMRYAEKEEKKTLNFADRISL